MKRKVQRSRRLLCISLAALTALPSQSWGLPTGGQVVSGQVTTTVNGAQMTLNQGTRAAIMNWQQFGIAPNEMVRILQSSPNAAMLARVIGNDPSALLGQLKADGRLFLINPRGIVVGAGAVIDTAAFMASTLDIADKDFLAGGPLTLKGSSDASVVNLGKISASEGSVLLIAHTVRNAGEISAPKGTAGLAAATELYLASPDAPTFVVKANLPTAAGTTGVENTGTIAAAQAQLEAAGGSIYDLAINQSGTVRATGFEQRPDGRVLLTAGAGTVAVNGVVSARNADGSGGEILVGGDYRGANPDVANAARTLVTANATLDASASSATGDGGRVVVWADDATRYYGRIEAKGGTAGGNGGFAEVSGKRLLSFGGSADLSAPGGRPGTLLLDPDDLTIVAGSTSLPTALQAPPLVWFSHQDPGAQTLGADTLAGLVQTGGIVSLQAANSLTVNAPVTVPAGAPASAELNLQAPTLTINESISLANAASGSMRLSGGGTLTTAAGATLTASRVRLDGFPIMNINGPISSANLEYANLGGATSFTATHPANAISSFLLNTDPADPQPVSFSGNVSVHSSTPMAVNALIGAANNVTLSSAGNLTLQAGTSITASGVTKLASTGGDFINQAGASALSGTGRRLIYTSDVTAPGFALGGLAGYQQFEGVAFPNDPQNLVTLVLYNAAGAITATLTITANDFIKLYGQADPIFTASFAGGTSADLTAQPVFTIQQGAHTNVGTYTIVPSGATSATHTIVYANGTLTINPATLTYTANLANRLYGDANPAFGGTIGGFVAGDTLASATTGTLAFASAATVTTNAGSTSIFGSGLTANNGNYVFDQAAGNFSALTINTVPLTVTINNVTRTYGSANPPFDATFTGFRNGDTSAVIAGFAPGTLATAASPVGTYPVGTGGSAPNYAITFVPGTLTVAPAPLTIAGTNLTMKEGDPVPPLGFTVSGLIGGDTPSVLSGVNFDTAFFSSIGPGTYSYGFSSTGTAANYTVAAATPGSLTVQAVPKSVEFVVQTIKQPATVAPPVTETIYLMNTDTKIVDLKTIDMSVKSADVKVGVTDGPVPPFIVANAALDFGDTLAADAGKLLTDPDVKDLTAEQRAFLESVRDKKVSRQDLNTAIQYNDSLRAAMMPVLGRSLMDALNSGKPLTDAQAALAARVASNLNESRRIYADELVKQQMDFMKMRADVGMANQYALVTMPDIAISAQQAATEKAIGAAIGAGAGMVVGVATIAALNTAGVVLGHTYAVSSLGVLQTTGTVTSVGAGAATAIIGVAVALVVVGVVSAVMVAQEGQNIDAFNAAQARANTTVNANLSNLDLKSDQGKADYLTAFMMTMLETR